MKENAMKYSVALFVASVFVVVLAANTTEVIGRPVTIAAAVIGYGGNYEEKMAIALEHVHASRCKTRRTGTHSVQGL